MRSGNRSRWLVPVAALVLAVSGLGRAATPTHPTIPWLGDWAVARAEAARLNKPMLFVFGAPRCGGVPGVW